MEKETFIPIELIEKYLTEFNNIDPLKLIELIKDSFQSGIDHCPHCAGLYE